MKIKGWLIVILVLIMSSLSKNVLVVPWWINLVGLILWILVVKIKPKYSWLCLVLLGLVNLNFNRLLYVGWRPFWVSFDREQSFWDYPGLREAIVRYGNEGLWLPYRLREVFYSSYLLFFSYLTGVVKLLSPLFWIRIVGFSGFGLLLLGWIDYFKNGFKKWYVGVWFLIIILTSAMRVLGDSVTAIYLTLPMLGLVMFRGVKSKFFKDYQLYWWLLFLIDILIR